MGVSLKRQFYVDTYTITTVQPLQFNINLSESGGNISCEYVVYNLWQPTPHHLYNRLGYIIVITGFAYVLLNRSPWALFLRFVIYYYTGVGKADIAVCAAKKDFPKLPFY